MSAMLSEPHEGHFTGLVENLYFIVPPWVFIYLLPLFLILINIIVMMDICCLFPAAQFFKSNYKGGVKNCTIFLIPAGGQTVFSDS